MVMESGRDAGLPNAPFTMKTCLPSPSWDGGPFADAIDRALWELGYPNDFDTEIEARAAVAEVLQHRPDLAGLCLSFVEA
jgi:hypothetical protein